MKNLKEMISIVVAVCFGFAIAMTFSLGIARLARFAAVLVTPAETETEKSLTLASYSLEEQQYPALAGFGSEEHQYPALAGFGAEPTTENKGKKVADTPLSPQKDPETIKSEAEAGQGHNTLPPAGITAKPEAEAETETETEVMADTEVEEEPLILPETEKKTKSEVHTDTTHPKTEPLILPESEEKTRSEDYINTHLMEPGKTIDPVCGVFQGPWLKETYYNLDMSYCIKIMQVHFGIDKYYWVRSDGVKMYGEYIMVAADTNVYPKGSIVETSLGTAMVVDHCEAAEWCPEFDIAVTW